jgi:hypothetical protein
MQTQAQALAQALALQSGRPRPVGRVTDHPGVSVFYAGSPHGACDALPYFLRTFFLRKLFF